MGPDFPLLRPSGQTRTGALRLGGGLGGWSWGQGCPSHLGGRPPSPGNEILPAVILAEPSDTPRARRAPFFSTRPGI